MASGISLANKCQLLFGAAVVLIVTAALVVPWLRLGHIVDDAQVENSRLIAELWADGPLAGAEAWHYQRQDPDKPLDRDGRRDLEVDWWSPATWEEAQFRDPFLHAAKRRLQRAISGQDGPVEHSEVTWDGPDRLYKLARLVKSDNGEPRGVVVVDRRSASAANQLLMNRAYLLAAGLIAGGLAVLVFYLITKKIILHPVRALRETAERVREGNLTIRSDLKTGDEFEQLAGAFNSMLANLEDQQQLLRGINRSLDMRLNELAERNTALYEAARLKGEFLANVSHELRTPLNSIIGFAEILQEIARHDENSIDSGPGSGTDSASLVKRKRYLDHIVLSGRSLLEMINELLAMAKIEAGNIELHVQRVNVAETCEALMALIKPLADRKRLRLTLQLQDAAGGFTHDARAADVPTVESDQQKLQQVVFNFLSNATKFTPEGGEVVIRAERLVGGDGRTRVRISVLDTGPGIPPSQHEYIFEKFSQLDSSHTREHQGTGLGLAIAKQFAELLQGEIQLVSEVGRGSMFCLILPLVIDAARVNEAKLELTQRAALAGRGKRKAESGRWKVGS